MKTKDLLGVFEDYSPRLLSTGQIRMECPFSENHTDGSGKMSFFATPEMNGYHCFSCRAHGNLVGLLSRKFSVNYFDAIEMVKLVEYEKEKPAFDLDISWNIKPPKEFLARGFTIETLKHFRLGVTDDHWVIIPFFMEGKLKGYQKRVDFPDRIVINNEDFNKQEYLYNLDFSYDYVIAVEGYSDVMRLFQFGYNATGVLGAGVSTWQASQIRKFKRVYLAFDNDEAGRRATEMCYHLIKHHTEVLIIPYLTKDPGECKSRRQWKKYFEQATDYADYTLEMTLSLDGYTEMKEEVLKSIERKL
jgi:5S rRNA maturation endonuclease (ribonuclease M5)